MRKRQVRDKIEPMAPVRELIEWEYHLAGRADEFYNAHPDLDPAAVIPLVEYATPFAARLAEDEHGQVFAFEALSFGVEDDDSLD